MSRPELLRFALIVVGLGLLFYTLLGEDLSRYSRLWWNRSRAEAPGWFTWRSAVPLIVALALAALMRVPLISGFIVIVGFIYLWRSYEKARIGQIAKITDQVGRLVFSFRSTYKLQPVVFGAMKESLRRLEDPLRGWVDVALRAYMATDSEEAMYQVLRTKTSNHYLNQFLYILEMSGSATRDTVIIALDNLAQRLRRQEDLRRQTEIELSSVSSQTGIIQVIGVSVLFIVALVPMLRDVYAKYPPAQLAYLFFASVAVATSFYIDRQIDKLKESVL